ncbi:hypothetical protein BDN67DRAFT_962616 [Paxillus ammoniavirescens]|nr:hypothetical protein BDN67DRAFT_962616 [Paxillus ammoniavirescens]
MGLQRRASDYFHADGSFMMRDTEGPRLFTDQLKSPNRGATGPSWPPSGSFTALETPVALIITDLCIVSGSRAPNTRLSNNAQNDRHNRAPPRTGRATERNGRSPQDGPRHSPGRQTRHQITIGGRARETLRGTSCRCRFLFWTTSRQGALRGPKVS